MSAVANNAPAPHVNAIHMSRFGEYPAVQTFVLLSFDWIGAQGDDICIGADPQSGGSAADGHSAAALGAFE